MTRRKQIVFAMTGAERVPGGIAALNLNVLPALERVAAYRQAGLRVLSYMESDADRPSTLSSHVPFKGFGGSRAAFSLALQQAALDASLVALDHVQLALPLLPLAAAKAVRTAVFAHGSEAWRVPKWTSKLSLRMADLCLANSAYTLRRIHEHLHGVNGVVCDLGLSPRFKLNAEIPPAPKHAVVLEAVDGRERTLGDQVFLLVGRIDPSERGKGHIAMVKALTHLKEKHPGVQLVCPGPGAGRDGVACTAARLGVDDSVFLPGYVEVDLLRHLYRQALAYTMPSRQEGFGLVYLEAMNYGKPCLGCYDDGAEASIVDGETGFLIADPQGVAELVDRLDTLLSDPAAAAEMGRKGFERLHARFTSEHVQERIFDHLIGLA